jgi:NAD(P)H-dependent FMN reductase
MSNNIVVLSGSPRKNGNTDQLVDAFIKGCKSVGKTVTLFKVAHMNIGACKACKYCFSHNGECVLKDDMLQILNTIKTADAVVFASPIYYANVTGQLKVAMDRTYANLMAMPKDLVIKFGRTPDPWTRGALLLTAASTDYSIADSTIVMYKSVLEHSNREDGGIVVATGVRERGEIEGHAALKQAEDLGREI